jgi:RNA polymerase sigma-70 factor (ECF subfamily)
MQSFFFMNPTLIEKAKSDPQAFGEIYEFFYEAVYKYIYFRVNSQETAEDLVSLIWEKVLFHLPKFQSNHVLGFRIWLFRIARNVLYTYYRQKKKEVTVAIDEEDLISEDNIIEHAKNKESNAYLIKLIQGLPENQREMVSLKFFSDFRNKEIAKIMDISERKVAVYLSRALKTLRSRVEILL